MALDKLPQEFTDNASEIPEMVENRRHTHAIGMLRKIITDLNPTDFTIEEIVGNFNAGTPLKQDMREDPFFAVIQIRYGQADLDYLAKRGFIEKITAGHYMVTPRGEIVGEQGTENDIEDTDELISPNTSD